MSNYIYTPSMRVGGTIRISRFVKVNTAEERELLEADAGDKTFGISQEGTQDPPGIVGSSADIAAREGEQMAVYAPGSADVLLKIGAGGVSPGDAIASDADGLGVVAGSGDYVGATAIETGDSGDVVRVVVVRSEVPLA